MAAVQVSNNSNMAPAPQLLLGASIILQQQLCYALGSLWAWVPLPSHDVNQHSAWGLVLPGSPPSHETVQKALGQLHQQQLLQH